MRALLLSLCLLAPVLARADAPPQPAPIVFLDIAGENLAAQKAFYADLFAWHFSATGNELSIPVLTPLPSALRQDPVEKRVYIGVADVAGTLEQIVAHGGKIDVPRFVVPGVAILGLFRDPAGNPMGLVEMAGGKPKVP